MWQPIHEQHAISAMAIVLQFSEALPQKSLRRVVAAAEEPAFASGLRSRNRTNALQVQFGEQGPLRIDSPAEGYVFSSLMRPDEGSPSDDQVSEQLLVDSTRLFYRTTVYASWQQIMDRVSKLFLPAAGIALDAVEPRAVRLEYLDRFVFTGDPADAKAGGLLKSNSLYLPEYIFDIGSQWHSHTGKFMDEDPNLLLQINVDAVDRNGVPVGNKDLKRVVDIMTALERRFPDAEDSHGLTEGALMHGLDRMHADLKIVLANLISDDMSTIIHLSDAAP